jgi:anhydro-N-acetylmuramic acid kinase
VRKYSIFEKKDRSPVNAQIAQLYAISQKKTRRIVGLMSGTSLDGLDVALCVLSGNGPQTQAAVTQFRTVPYDADFKSDIRAVFAKREIDFQQLVLLHAKVAERHAAIVLDSLQQWGVPTDEVDLIASHGQTVFHAPKVLHGLPDEPNATLQIGDGDHIARRTGIITVSDFRQKHVAAGGEGAPLALYGDYFLLSKRGEERFLLNIGGIANFTYLPADGDPSRAFATDTGPGNTLLDNFAQRLFGVAYDADARLASRGRVVDGLLDTLRADAFFGKNFPKTIGPEHFSPAWVDAALDALPKGFQNPYDIMATLTALTAETIADALLRTSAESSKPCLYLSGGGAHNPLITKLLQEKLPDWPIRPMQEIGVDGDAKEALLFALLANEAVAGNYAPGERLGGIPLVAFGKISFPN